MVVLDPEADRFKMDSWADNGLAARRMLAADVCGGWIVVAVAKDRESVGADVEDLLGVSVKLPVKMKNAVAPSGRYSILPVFQGGSAHREISSEGRVAVGLLLVPTGR